MADFAESIGIILKHEGGLVNHKNDPGGLTNKGITLKTFERYAKEHLGIEPTAGNLRNLSTDQASVIYQNEYWNANHLGEIQNQQIADHIFDFRVNSGGAIKQVQKALKELGHDINPDGKMGPKTIDAINASKPEILGKKLIETRTNYINGLINKNPKLEVFRKGWMKRINDFNKTLPKTEDYFEKLKSLNIC